MKRACLFMFCFAFFALSISFSCADEAEFGTVSGRLIQADGSPQQEAVFLLFNTQTGPPPAPGKYFRSPDGPAFVDEDGNFQLRMPPGEYWYGVVKRMEDGERANPEFSDWLYVSRSSEGLYSLTIEKDQTTSIGELLCTAPLPEFVAGELPAIEVSGVIQDQTQTPLPNFFVEVSSQKPGLSGPLFTSAMTSADGRYAIKLAVGEYALRLRQVSGPNRNGFRNKNAEKYLVPKPVALSASGESKVINRDFVVKDKSKNKDQKR